MDKFTEWKGVIAKVKVETFHGVVTINGKELDWLDEPDASINEVIIALLREKK